MSIFLELFRGPHQVKAVLQRRLELSTRVELGRCTPTESPDGSETRLIIAPPQETTFPRRWFVVHKVDEQKVRVENVHSDHSVIIEDLFGPILPRGSREILIDQPVVIKLSDELRLVITDRETPEIDSRVAQQSDFGIRSLVADRSVLSLNASRNPAQATMLSMRPLAGGRGGVEVAAVVGLIEKALNVVTAAAGGDKFLEAAVKAAVEIVGLDRAAIIGREAFESLALDEPSETAMRLLSQGWHRWVQYAADRTAGHNPPAVSLSVLKRVDALRRTQICDAPRNLTTQSMTVLSSVVAAPILDRDQNLVAILYGDRWLMLESDQDEVSELEGLLLEVLAGAVAGGIARQAEEKSRHNLSEFFSPRVASMLAERQDLLVGKDAEVSVLFCDIRGFSTISEKYGAAKTIAWINDVLTELSQCVVDRDGVLVDYVGDALFAMWGAPEAQPDHAERALGAALAMLRSVERLRMRADHDFAAELDVRMGINSGPARVGNVGSRLKFKYGVLGHTVNVGSRLQDNCKYLGVRCLASAATIDSLCGPLDPPHHARRIATLKVAGIEEKSHVYECLAEVDEAWETLRREYEMALADFEAGRPGETVHRLGKLLQSHPHDRPSAILLSKAAHVLTHPEADYDSTWNRDA